MVKNLPANAGDIREAGLIPRSGRRRAWQPIPVFLSGESHRQRSLVGYSIWGHTESDTTEAILAETSSSYSTLNKGFSSCITLDSRDVT